MAYFIIGIPCRTLDVSLVRLVARKVEEHKSQRSEDLEANYAFRPQLHSLARDGIGELLGLGADPVVRLDPKV